MQFLDWGILPYEEAFQEQMGYLYAVADGDEDESIAFCAHPESVIQKQNLFGGKGCGDQPIYYNPSQVVTYLMLNLNKRERNLNKFVKSIEKAVIDSLAEFGIQSAPSEWSTGVWVENKKIAAIDIAVKNWVSYYGVIVNMEKQATESCGACSHVPMISVEEVLGKKISQKDFISTFSKYLLQI